MIFIQHGSSPTAAPLPEATLPPLSSMPTLPEATVLCWHCQLHQLLQSQHYQLCLIRQCFTFLQHQRWHFLHCLPFRCCCSFVNEYRFFFFYILIITSPIVLTLLKIPTKKEVKLPLSHSWMPAGKHYFCAFLYINYIKEKTVQIL